MKPVRLLALLVPLFAAPSATAQSLEVAAGAALPTGNYRATDRPGWLGMVALGAGSGTSGFGIRLEGLYGETGRKAPNSGKTRLAGAMSSIVWQIPGSGGAIKPFLLLGAGAIRARSDLSPSGTSSRTGFTIGGGVGLTFPLGPVNFITEGRYLTIRRSGGHLDLLPISAGVILGF